MDKIITLLGADRTAQGPFTVQEVTQKIETGEIRPDNLAHIPGLTQWSPVNQVLAQVSLAKVVPPAGQYQPNAYAIHMSVPDHQYAHFMIRFAALLVDRIAITILAMILIVICLIPFIIYCAINHDAITQFQDNSNINDPSILLFIILLYGGIIVATLGAIIADWLYHAWMESGPAEGTFGKQLLGIRVTDLQGRQISFMRATGRHFARIFLSNAVCLIGYFIAAFTEKKQALHDMVASTVVVQK